MAIVYTDVGRHPKRPEARMIVERDDEGFEGSEMVYYGYPRMRMMWLYPADRFTAQHSRVKKIKFDRIRKEIAYDAI